MLGAPPPVLKLSGYGAKNISPIPVVLESYSTSWPNDIDYLPTNTGDPFPVIMEIELTLKESYSPAEYSKFNLFAYKTGDLSEAFSGAKFEAKTSASAANEKSNTSEPSILGGGPASIIGKTPASMLSGVQGQAQGLISTAQGFANQAGGMLAKVEAEVKSKIGTSITSGINLVKDSTVKFRHQEKLENGIIPVDYEGIARDVTIGEKIMLDDGKLILEVMKVEGDVISAKVICGGLLKQRKGINIPGSQGSLNVLTDRDKGFVKFAIENEIDYLGLSFVRDAKEKGCEIVYGYKMLLYQAAAQFELFTGINVYSIVCIDN
jgi:hypothetical protein